MKVVKIKRAIARMNEGSESFRYYVPETKTALVRDKQCRGGSRKVVGKKSYDVKMEKAHIYSDTQSTSLRSKVQSRVWAVDWRVVKAASSPI